MKNKELCIKAIESLDEVMRVSWFPLNLRDKILKDIFKFYGFKEEELSA